MSAVVRRVGRRSKASLMSTHSYRNVIGVFSVNHPVITDVAQQAVTDIAKSYRVEGKPMEYLIELVTTVPEGTSPVKMEIQGICRRLFYLFRTITRWQPHCESQGKCVKPN